MNENKKIVLITPQFFEYEKHLEKAFIQENNTVYMFNERGAGKTIDKIIIRLFPQLIQRRINKYYQSILDSIDSQEIDILVVNKSETMPIWFVEKFKKRYPNSTTLHYMQDSIKNYPKILDKAQKFDYALTFDREDSIQFDWIFRPYFFTDDYRPREGDIEEYDLSFIGTIHSDRSTVLEKILNNFSNRNKDREFIFFYVPLKFMFLFGKYIKKQYTNIDLKDVSTTSLKSTDVSDIVRNSKCIIDIQHNKQTGVTARTIETLGAKKKLITTNSDIKNYDFYNENNVLIIDRNNPKISMEWMKKDYEPIDPEIYEYYSIQEFVETFIQLANNHKAM